MEDNNSTTIQLVTFQLGEENYGIDIMNVKEINAMQEIRPIPSAPEYIEGLFNLRGEIIPVINLHKRFGIPRPVLSEDDELMSGFVILKIENMMVGIIIDKILRVVTYDLASIQQPPKIISGISGEYIRGVVHEETKYLIILDIVRLFSREELRAFASLNH